MKQARLLIRADASVAIGTGHVMRCLALAQAWQDAGGGVTFAIGEAPVGVKRRLMREGFSVVRISAESGSKTDAERTAQFARELGASWIVVDGDRFGPSFSNYLRRPDVRILLMDDFSARASLPVDLVVNPNLGFREQDYTGKIPRRALLLGPRYVFLRREFSVPPTKKIFPKSGNRILVTLGGSDPENLGPRIARILAKLPSYEVTLVAGPGYAHTFDPTLKANRRVRMMRNPPNLRELMEQSDIAIIAAGGTLWELLYLGCAVLSYSRNTIQQRVVDELVAKGAVRDLGATKRFNAADLRREVVAVAESKDIRERMSKSGRKILDGRGTERVLQAIRQFDGKAPVVSTITVAPSERSEFMKLAQRHFTELDSTFVPHEDWKREYFENIRSNPNFFLRWIQHRGERAGFILFGIEKHRFLPRKTGMIYELYILPQFRKRGLAHMCAAQAIRELQVLGPSKIQLEVMEGNAAAMALWKSLDFQKVSERLVLARAAQ